ncbi:MAG: HD-GYP domain-containing protein [Lachnospiraceae bacterium]|nr:HD-GYP domain-containing protein [Lachnospiraceae bacterium]
MRRIPADSLVPGMITAEDVFSYDNQLILPKGLTLTDKAITKLAYYSIFSIKVEDELSTAFTSSVDDDRSYYERVKSSQEFLQFKKEYSSAVEDFQDRINDMVHQNRPFNVEAMMTPALKTLFEKDNHVNVLDMLHNMRDYDDATYMHCMNVALICNIFARWLNLSREEIHVSTLCGLMHDIGKIQIPDAIIKKPAKLTDKEYNIIKTHPIEGYNLVRNTDLNTHIKNAILMHHERNDGSGYPLGLIGERIDPYAQIVSIADVYDAMTSARVYRGPLCPFAVIGLFEDEGFQKYNPQFILTFLENVVNTYLLNRVRLSNGLVGEVVYIDKDHLSRPTIKSGSRYLDLSSTPELRIEAII